MIGKAIRKNLARAAVGGGLWLVAGSPAAALPGMVTGEAIGSVSLQIADNSALVIDLALPQFHISYASTGDVHEDGSETGYVFPGYEIVLGMDVYAYAFSEPLVTGQRVSETHGRGWFDDGVFATISNRSATTQSVEILVANAMSLDLSTSQPHDRVSGSYSYTLTGSGDAAGFRQGFSARLRPPAGVSDAVNDGFATNYTFDLAPNGSYQFRIDDYQMNFFLHAAAVPEPESWALSIVGFGLAGMAMRRRRAMRYAC